MDRDFAYIAGFDPRSYRHYYSSFKKNLALYESLKKQKFTLSKPQIFAISQENSQDDFKNDKNTHSKNAKIHENPPNSVNFSKISAKNSQNSRSLTDKNPKNSHIENPAQNAIWQVSGDGVRCDYHFLAYNDIIKENWYKNLADVLKDLVFSVKIYLCGGLISRFFAARKHSMIAGFYPLLLVLGGYFLAFLAAFLAFLVTKSLLFALIFGVVAFFLAGKGIFFVGNKNAAFWLSRIYAFCAQYARNEIAGISERCDSLAEYIYFLLQKNENRQNYELILCSHSVGTIVAVSVAARVFAMCEQKNISTKNLKIITLGECIPLSSFQKNPFKNPQKNSQNSVNFKENSRNLNEISSKNSQKNSRNFESLDSPKNFENSQKFTENQAQKNSQNLSENSQFSSKNSQKNSQNFTNFQNELAFLASQKGLFWADFTAKIDGACFYLYDFLGDFKGGDFDKDFKDKDFSKNFENKDFENKDFENENFKAKSKDFKNENFDKKDFKNENFDKKDFENENFKAKNDDFKSENFANKTSKNNALKAKIRLFSVPFYKLYTPKSYKKLRYRWYKVHFLYLDTPEILGKYDFFGFLTSKDFLEKQLENY